MLKYENSLHYLVKIEKAKPQRIINPTMLAVKLGVCTSTIDRYKNESCDFSPENRDKLFNKISSISGIAMSSLIQSETEYQEQSQLIRDSAKDENISMPSLYYQK